VVDLLVSAHSSCYSGPPNIAVEQTAGSHSLASGRSPRRSASEEA